MMMVHELELNPKNETNEFIKTKKIIYSNFLFVYFIVNVSNGTIF